jgi:outer membrane immunogenic protein
LVITGEGEVKNFLLAGIALVALAAPAAAADMPVKALPPAPIDIWTGGYVGVNVGYDWGRDTVNSSASPGACTTVGFGGCDVAPINGVSIASAQALSFTTQVNHSGFIYGGQAGHNWLVHNLAWTWDGVLGVEVDFQGKSDHHSNTISTTGQVPAPATAFVVASQNTLTEKIDTLGTFRGRAGLLWGPSTLVYLTGGVAWASATSGASFSQTGNPLFGAVGQPFSNAGQVTSEVFGPVIGGGVEWKWTPNLSIKAEYLYADLGSLSFNTTVQSRATAVVPGAIYSTATANINTHLRDNIARVGVNYRFW